MKKIKIYEYDKCSTCRNALKFLQAKKIDFVRVPIVDHPPTKSELRQMLQYVGGDIKRLFNTSGQLYRELKMSEKITKISADEAIELLSKHGKLIKRPFVLIDGHGLVGFKELDWKKAF